MENKLYHLRVERNYSQEHVAEYLDISQPAYSNLEKGQVKLTVDRAGKLAELYNIDPEYFFTNDAPVVNFNSGSKNENVLQNVANFNTGLDKDFFEKIIQAKDQQIETLQKQIDNLHEQVKQFLEILKNQ